MPLFQTASAETDRVRVRFDMTVVPTWSEYIYLAMAGDARTVSIA